MKRSKSELSPLVINGHPIDNVEHAPHSASEAVLSRTFSDYFDVTTPADAYTAYRIVLEDYENLTRSLRALQKEFAQVAEKADEWKLKYSSRFVFVSNGLVAIYLLGRRIFDLCNDNYANIIRYLFNPAGWLKLGVVSRLFSKIGTSNDSNNIRSTQFKRKYIQNIKMQQKKKHLPSWRMRNHETFNSFLLRAFWPQVLRCVMFVFSGYWLMKHETEDWKRDVGFVIALLTNIYEAVESDSFNFGIYLNLLALFVFLAARYFKSTIEETMDVGEEGSLALFFDDDDPGTPLPRTWSSHAFKR
jgi:hypothetical protein